jgi:tRNA(Ile2) C34 agmatinyltransferase TiaS
MKILLCIDDTDMLGGKGTGKLMEELSANLSGYMELTSGFVSRHQLFVHESIPFTSHNSAMCREVAINEENIPLLIERSKVFLEGESAPGSDPGLCVVLREKLTKEELVNLIAFGHRAKREVLTKRMAYALAEKSKHVHLSEHGGTGQGIIGALAGCGLRSLAAPHTFRGPSNWLDSVTRALRFHPLLELRGGHRRTKLTYSAE